MALVATQVWANPPFPNSTYNLYANNQLVGVLKIPCSPSAPPTCKGGDQPGATLDAGSYVEAACTTASGNSFTAHSDLQGIAINNPAGVINAFPAASRKNVIIVDPSKGTDFGTLINPRLFMRWYPSQSGAPTQSPPQGPPGGGQTASGPSPGDIGTGSFGGRNNPPSASSQRQFFCSFSQNFFAQKISG